MPEAALDLPAMSYQMDRVHRLNAKTGVMPRDFRLRLSKETAAVKIHHIPGDVCSSLYRSVAYLAMAEPPYLQLVSGCREKAFDSTMGWFEQEPLNPASPAGIRHSDEFERLLMQTTGVLDR